MNQPPRPPKENLFAGGLITKIILSGVIMTIASLFIQYWAMDKGYDVKTQQTMVFTTLCFVQLGNALSVRSNHKSMFSSALFSNPGMWGTIALTIILQLLIVYVPFLDIVFKTTYLDWKAMTAILIVTFLSILFIEALKYLANRKYRK